MKTPNANAPGPKAEGAHDSGYRTSLAGDGDAGKTVLAQARRLVAACISVIPIRANGTKALALQTGERKTYEQRLPTDDELVRWFGTGNLGYAILMCEASSRVEQRGQAEVTFYAEALDFETDDVFQAWKRQVEHLAVYRRLCICETPGPGKHVPYRSPVCEKGQKLARTPREIPGHKPGADGLTTLIETRGHSQYIVGPGSPGTCHETGRPWRHVAGPPPEEMPSITSVERKCLLAVARMLSEAPAAPTDAERPGDDFEARGPGWDELFTPHGWTLDHTDGDMEFWRRPGKDRSWSATAGPRSNGENLLCVFSTNAAPFEAGKSYGKFRAFATLNHGGDLSAAARELRRQGYGSGAPPAANGELPVIDGPEGIKLRIVDAPRRSAEKLTVLVDVVAGKEKLPGLTVTSTPNGLDSAAKEIMVMLPPAGGRDAVRALKTELKRTLRKVLAAAEEVNKNRPERPSILAVLRKATGRLQLSFRYGGRVWSEAREGRWLALRDLRECLITPSVLKELLGCGEVERPDPVLAVMRADRLMPVLWSELLDDLPVEAEADLGPQSAAARRWRERIAERWLEATVWRKDGSHAVRTSLAARGYHQLARVAHGRWLRAHEGQAAWVRRNGSDVELAMRAELLDRRQADGVTEHRTWARLMARYGLVGETARVEADRTKVRVLQTDLCRHIVDVAVDEPLPDKDLEDEEEPI